MPQEVHKTCSTRGRHARRFVGALCAFAALSLTSPAAGVAQDSSPPIGTVSLTNIYRGDDGALMYTRHVGSRIVGFAEHPRTGVAFTFRATLSGNSITGTGWDLPKGTRTQVGAIGFKHSNAGTTLVRSGGADFGAETWKKLDPGTITSWPGDRTAGFQATQGDDLTGAFEAPHTDAPSANRMYATETDNDVVFVIERRFTAATARPSWVAAFFGKRTASGIQGDWFGLPKGGILRHGKFAAGMSAFDRDFSISAWDDDTFLDDAQYKPDYAVDYAKFGEGIEARLDAKVVGYSYAIAKNGKIVASNAKGSRNLEPFPFPFNLTTESDVASTSKTVTAVAVVRALWQRGLTVDTKVEPYLPEAWARGAGIDGLTFRRLLDHTADLFHPGDICDSDGYKCLKEAIAGGIIDRPDDKNYNNIHYAIMRVLLPFIVDGADMKQAFEDHDPETDGATLNQMFSDSFSDYVLGMLASRGVSASFAFQTSDWAYGYQMDPEFDGPFYPEQTNLKAGSGSLKMTAPEYLEFLMGFESGKFVPWSLVDEMKEGRLGFDDLAKAFTGRTDQGFDIGFLYTKNGTAGGYQSQSQIYPSDVQVFLTLTGSREDWDLKRVLRAPYEEAMI